MHQGHAVEAHISSFELILIPSLLYILVLCTCVRALLLRLTRLIVAHAY